MQQYGIPGAVNYGHVNKMPLRRKQVSLNFPLSIVRLMDNNLTISAQSLSNWNCLVHTVGSMMLYGKVGNIIYTGAR